MDETHIRSEEDTNGMSIYILVLPFMGPQQGRIIHAHYNKRQRDLTLQYSVFFDFARKKDVPVELFYRYVLSSPVKP